MPDAADLVAAADTLVQSSLFNEAIATYTKAIELAPTAPGYYIKRCLNNRSSLLTSISSTAHQRAGNFEAALKVCHLACQELMIGCGTSRGSC
jgi:hypothetical protein